MEAILLSAKVSVFYSKFNKTFPKSPQRFYLAQTLIKHIKPLQDTVMNSLFIYFGVKPTVFQLLYGL